MANDSTGYAAECLHGGGAGEGLGLLVACAAPTGRRHERNTEKKTRVGRKLMCFSTIPRFLFSSSVSFILLLFCSGYGGLSSACGGVEQARGPWKAGMAPEGPSVRPAKVGINYPNRETAGGGRAPPRVVWANTHARSLAPPLLITASPPPPATAALCFYLVLMLSSLPLYPCLFHTLLTTIHC